MRGRYVGLSVAVAAIATGALAAACGTDGTTAGRAPDPDPDSGIDAGPADPSALCVDGKRALAYPPEPHALRLAATLPNTSFEGERGAVSLADSFDPCAERSRLLVIRTSALWCSYRSSRS